MNLLEKDIDNQNQIYANINNNFINNINVKTSNIIDKIVITKSNNEQNEYTFLIHSISIKEKQLNNYKDLLSINIGNDMYKRIEEIENKLIELRNRKKELDKLSDR